MSSLMPRVFIYHNASDKVGTLCRLLSKAAVQGKRVAVFSQSEAVLDAFDRHLWTFDQTSFVPHCRAGAALENQTPIILTQVCTPQPGLERLCNLDSEAPSGIGAWLSLFEVVGQDEKDRALARDRFRLYKKLGYDIQAFDVQSESRKDS